MFLVNSCVLFSLRQSDHKLILSLEGLCEYAGVNRTRAI